MNMFFCNINNSHLIRNKKTIMALIGSPVNKVSIGLSTFYTIDELFVLKIKSSFLVSDM